MGDNFGTELEELLDTIMDKVDMATVRLFVNAYYIRLYEKSLNVYEKLIIPSKSR